MGKFIAVVLLLGIMTISIMTNQASINRGVEISSLLESLGAQKLQPNLYRVNHTDFRVWKRDIIISRGALHLRFSYVSDEMIQYLASYEGQKLTTEKPRDLYISYRMIPPTGKFVFYSHKSLGGDLKKKSRLASVVTNIRTSTDYMKQVEVWITDQKIQLPYQFMKSE